MVKNSYRCRNLISIGISHRSILFSIHLPSLVGSWLLNNLKISNSNSNSVFYIKYSLFAQESIWISTIFFLSVLVQRLTKLIMTNSKKIMPTGVSTLNL